MKDEQLLVVRVTRAYDKFVWSLAAISMLSVALMSVGTTLDVIKRWITGWPFGGMMQLSECLMVVMVFMGLAYAQRHRRHIRIAFLVSHMRKRTMVKMDIIACALSAICLALMGAMTAQEAAYSFSILEYRAGDVRLPIYWARALIPLGCFAMFGQLIIEIWTNMEKLKGKLPMDVRDIRSLGEESH